MDKSEDTSKWLKFFKDAGIPTKTGASYALIFVENRIKMDLLSELTVDYLRLMGITLMGDIIAILRHCKNVHQDSMRKVVILKSKEEPVERSESSSSSSSDSSSSSSDEVEMVEVPKKTTMKKVPTVSSKVSSVQVKKSIPLLKEETKPLRSRVGTKLTASVEKKIEANVTALKRKYFEDSMEVDEIPVVKEATLKSDVLPSNPSSTLVKKMKVGAENEYFGPKLPPTKKTVFDRLGAEIDSPQVSSTTEVHQPKSEPQVVETKFTRVIGNVNLPIKTAQARAVSNSSKQMPSVFNRLGGVGDETEAEVKGSLQYAGILKSPPQKVVVRQSPLVNIIKRVGTMRADEPQKMLAMKRRAAAAMSPAVRKPINRLQTVKDTSLKTRLKPIKINRAGLTNLKSKYESAGIFANPYNEAANISAKERLGLTTSSVSSYNKNLNRPLPAQIRNKTTNPAMKNNLANRLGLSATKKVSFGRVEERTISPARTNIGFRGRNRNSLSRSGVHSRLGVK